MKIPTHLRHSPIICAEDYNRIDGKFANRSDTEGLSVGLAQWSRGKDISAKVWRHTGEKWSRQSEELPLHRVLDLAIMICKSYAYMKDSYRIPGGYNPDASVIGAIEVQGGRAPLNICTDNPNLKDDFTLFAQAIDEEDELLSERFKVLGAALEELGY